MKLSYFTMPLHPLGRNYTDTLREDREAIILADKLGFEEAFVGEHVTDLAETITSSLLFLATLAGDTETIKLCTGTVNLPQNHPALIASQVAMLDHILEGRFMLGISGGALPSDAEALGIPFADRVEMMVESIDHILALWNEEPPYRRYGKHWTISTENTHIDDLGLGVFHKPYQLPHPPIVGTVVEPFSKGVVELAARGWFPLSGGFLLPKWVATHWPKYVEGCERVGRHANPADWRVAKSIFVADDANVADDYGRTSPTSPYRHYFSHFILKAKMAGRINLFKPDRDLPDDYVTVERALDDLVICGDVDSVVDQILAFREEIGDFGTLVYAGHDWVDADLSRRSMELMATEVMPRISDAI
ncbi:MAG: LLM class flavin-dependent oxidoreductase [Acidimicrobiia bacterium]|nr:LLM class flavin-dependent oxidoreductase [Acidimicrobiia bacterium]